MQDLQPHFDQDTLTQQFADNLSFFKGYAPPLYKEFSSYQPEQYQLAIDDNDTINIIKDTEWFYTAETISAIKENLNSIEKKCCSNEYNILIQGIGLGFHLERLANTPAIKVLIHEPEKDIFFASLFTCDYSKVISKNNITLIIGDKHEHVSLNLIFSKHSTLQIQSYSHPSFLEQKQHIDVRQTKINRGIKQLNKNLSFFEKKIPSIYNFFKNYTPTEYFFTIDKEQHPNIISGNTYFYNESPEKICDIQINNHKEKGHYLRSMLKEAQPHSYAAKHFLHTHIAGVITRETEISDKVKYVPSLFFLGTGLGYHILDLISIKKNIMTYIFEPEPDIFYASLHSIDYEELINSQKNKSAVYFLIGQTGNNLIQLVHDNGVEKGIHVNSSMQLIEHYKTEKIDEAVHLFKQYCSSLCQQLGFFEDETVGVAHTLYHINPSEYFYKPQIQENRKEYALVVASGPSIDTAIDIIKEIKDQVIIISCSSSIEILHKNGIIPDYHAETERTNGMYERLKTLNDQEYLDQITLLTINTIHPDVLKMFKKRINFFKANDAGEELFNQVSDTHFDKTFYCNPTSGNAAVAFIHALGFNKIIFTGLDFGQKDDSKHHSSHTLYFSETKHKLDEIKSSLTLDGNFGGTIKTTELLLQSKRVVEILISRNVGMNCINCSDGVYIQGTTPLEVSKLTSTINFKDIDKTQIKNDILTKKTVQLIDSKEEIAALKAKFNKHWLKALNDAVLFSETLFPKNTHNINLEKLYKHFGQVQAKLKAFKKQNPVSGRLIQGSLNVLSIITFSVLNTRSSQQEVAEVLHKCLPVWNNYFQLIHQCVIENMGKPHEQTDISKQLTQFKEILEAHNQASVSQYKVDIPTNQLPLFKKNLDFLNRNKSSLFDKFATYTPQTHFLERDSFNQYNISLNNNWLYSGQTETLVQSQIQNYIHQVESLDTNISTLIILGVGLGFHLEKLIKTAQNIVIYEPHADFFYASLATTDYEKIAHSHLSRPNTSIHFLVDKKPEEVIVFLKKNFADKQTQLVDLGLFKHYQDEVLDQSSQLIKKLHSSLQSTANILS